MMWRIGTELRRVSDGEPGWVDKQTATHVRIRARSFGEGGWSASASMTRWFSHADAAREWHCMCY